MGDCFHLHCQAGSWDRTGCTVFLDGGRTLFDNETYHWRELPQVSFFLSRQTRVSCDKSFVVTKVCLLRQNVCRDKNVGRDKIFFGATNVLSCLSRVYLSCDKTCFVATKIILAAAPANDKNPPWLVSDGCAMHASPTDRIFFFFFFFSRVLISTFLVHPLILIFFPSKYSCYFTAALVLAGAASRRVHLSTCSWSQGI